MSTSSSTPSSPRHTGLAALELPTIDSHMVKVSQRPTLSCTECSRKKTKCDKQIPCQNCRKRNKPHLCCVPVHVRKPTNKSMKRITSPVPTPSASSLLTPPATISSLPLPLPLPNPPPPSTVATVSTLDSSILNPLYAEIDQLRAVVGSLQSRVHELEGTLSFVLSQAQPHPEASNPHSRPDDSLRDHTTAHLSPPPPPPPVQGYPFYPFYPPFYPAPNAATFQLPSNPSHPVPPPPPSLPSSRASNDEPYRTQSSRHHHHHHNDDNADVRGINESNPTSVNDPVAAALRLTNVSTSSSSSHYSQFPDLPNHPTIPSTTTTATMTMDEKDRFGDGHDHDHHHNDNDGAEATLSSSQRSGACSIRRRGSSSLEKLLSPNMNRSIASISV